MKTYCRGVHEYTIDGRKAYDIMGQWAYTIAAAKRKAMMDSGFTSKDFVWEEK